MLMLQYREHGECIFQEICAAFRGEHPADLLIVCEGKELLRAHKLILAAASPLIRMLLEEISVINEVMTTIHFPDISAYHFRILLDFLYSGEAYVPAYEVENLHDLLALLQMSDLKSLDHFKNHSAADINGNDAYESPHHRNRSKSPDSPDPPITVKRERLDSSCGDNAEVVESAELLNADECKIEKQSPETEQNTPDQNSTFVPYLNSYIDDLGPQLFLGDSPSASPNSQPADMLLQINNKLVPASTDDLFQIAQLYPCDEQTSNSERDIDRQHQPTKNNKPPKRKSSGHEITPLDETQCTICGKQFYRKTNLKRHMRLHTHEKSFSCQLCSCIFTQKYNLLSHLSFKHRKAVNAPTQFTCCFCWISFDTRPDLMRHLSSEHKEMLMSNRMRRIQLQMNVQQRKIEDNRSDDGGIHRCKFCDKQFDLAGNLKIHMRLHTGDKPYSCRFCVVKFTQKISLLNHLCTWHRHRNDIGSSDGDDRFSCCFCALWYDTKTELIRHLSYDHNKMLLSKSLHE